MPITVEAIYEGGVLRPAQPLPLPEYVKVRLTIEAPGDWVRETAGILKWTGTPEELQRFAEDPELDYPPAPGEP
jgi:predicted DNA-binding antitoxin AbrB/MazE fold protein